MKKIRISFLILLFVPFVACTSSQNSDNQDIQNLEVKELIVDSLDNQIIKTSTNQAIEGFDDAPKK